jgi:hypothetical protein
MSTVNAYSAWVNGKGSVSVLCGVESDSLSAFSLGLQSRLLRTAIHTFAMEVFEKSFGIKAEDIAHTSSGDPFKFQENGLQPVNLASVFGRAVRIQIIETADFNEAVSYKIINEKDAKGNYIVRESAFKLDRETKQRVTDGHGNFVYRKCFLRPDIEDYADKTMVVKQRTTADINSLTENIPVDETANVDDVPF